MSKRAYVEFQAFAGPIPPPQILDGYEQICPGAADRILTQFEEQGRHRRELENRVVRGNIVSSRIGQLTGFVIFMTGVVGSIWLLSLDKTLEGLASIIAALGSAAWALRKAQKQQEKDLAAKRGQAKS